MRGQEFVGRFKDFADDEGGFAFLGEGEGFFFDGCIVRIGPGLDLRGVLIATDVGLLIGGVQVGGSGRLLKGRVPSFQEVFKRDLKIGGTS